MTQPSPAIVTQDAARRLPRWALLLLCIAYVIPGYVGREPWKNADITSFGYMLALLDAGHWREWLQPSMMGMVPDSGALLPYWLGAAAMLLLAPLGVAPDFAARVPYMLMLAGTLAATWYGVYHLARHPSAQPVAFAFGGEAEPLDYARALADGSLLALIATLGLAQFSHETTPALAQLFFGTLVFYGLAALPARPLGSWLGLLAGLPGLTLSGAPATALIYAGLGMLALGWPGTGHVGGNARWRALAQMLALAALCVTLALALNLFRWQIAPWRSSWAEWSSLGRLFLWFTWPVWPFVLWTLWRWRRQLLSLRQQRHLGLPLAIASVPVLTTLATLAGDRALLLALPALAALAALALPTFSRSVGALIDWFTVLFFTGWALVIWVVWVAMETGVPAKPAANVARLAPGFEPAFQWAAFLAALLGTLAWFALARWRTGRHRTALWKSVVLPAAGTALCWLLLMTLWLPALDFGRSYAPQMQQVRALIGDAPCVEVHGLGEAQVAAVRFHGGWLTVPARGPVACPWLLVNMGTRSSLPATVALDSWREVGQVRRPTDRNETLHVLRRVARP
ncbi:hypothetical protein J1M35_16145 [Ottowia testudinis]|uniref:4-amino-4-deoxy-L-arabinose transferase-like glycosyltransferase n=1 Tax=Ottowia testudinis TaxID=2816950 RepID=A0A975H507_9BURK|nr:hypothetical protein [Ottowia testudinis]QTD47433.1 hypothetical protein J1M35_16145 [Ottowia testudinis]